MGNICYHLLYTHYTDTNIINSKDISFSVQKHNFISSEAQWTMCLLIITVQPASDLLQSTLYTHIATKVEQGNAQCAWAIPSKIQTPMENIT